MAPAPQVRFLDPTTPPHIVTLVLLAGLSAMNMSVFLPSLPEMAEYFETDYAVMQLSVSLYLAATAGLQLIVGPLSDRYGRRPVMLWSIALFLVATLGCLLAPSVEVFLVFRLIQAAVAVGMVLSRAVVRDMVPMDQAASMIGYVTMGMAMVPMFAPSIGGGLDILFGWQAVFVMLLLAGSAVWWLAWRDLGETATQRSASFRAQFADYPELLSARRFWGYAAAAAFASGCFFLFLGGAPYASSNIYGLDAFWTGVGFAAPAIGYATGNYISGRFAARVGVNRMMVWGAGIATVALGIGVLLGLAGIDTPVTFFAFCVSIGIGNGLVMPSAQAGLLSVRPHLAGTASGLGGAVMIGGGAALSVLAGVVLVGSDSALPLLALMFASSVLCQLAVAYVIHRTRAVGADA